MSGVETSVCGQACVGVGVLVANNTALDELSTVGGACVRVDDGTQG
jgi:hypothetical protein